MRESTDYEFVSGGIILKKSGFDRFEKKSLRIKILVLVCLVLLCWLPLAALSFIQHGWHQFSLLFVRDIATHVRFLLAMPLLLLSRYAVNNSFNKMVDMLYETKIVDDKNSTAFEEGIQWALKWRNSTTVDIILVILVYYAFYIKASTSINNATSVVPWLMKEGSFTIAGWWYLLFSLPLLQLIIYRWFYTIFLWIIFLRKTSKINLHLSSLHPDGVGGLGFLRYTQLSFIPVAFAFSSIAAAGFNNVLIFSKASIYDFQVVIISVLGLTLLIFSLPLLVFTALLSVVKKEGILSYSRQAWLFARQYENELKEFDKNEENKPDASWHIDMIGSFEKTSSMSAILIDKKILISFSIAVLLPFIPVLAQEVPLKEVLLKLISMLFG